MSITGSIERLEYLLEIIPEKLSALNDSLFSQKTDPLKWSRKEILGHLIDSAANNHQRFIRIQYENEPVIFYDQDKWMECTGYLTYAKGPLILLWTTYNAHLLHIGKHLTPTSLLKCGIGFDGKRYDLAYYFKDYVTHLEHHLRQIIEY